jgi:hypothetical protein
VSDNPFDSLSSTPKKKSPVAKPKSSPEGEQAKLAALEKYRHAGGSAKSTARKRRAAQAVAESARVHEEQLKKVFVEATDEGQPMRIRLEGATQWLKIEREEDRLQAQEDAYADMSRAEIANVALEKILNSPLADLLKERLLGEQPAIDSTATEIDD